MTDRLKEIEQQLEKLQREKMALLEEADICLECGEPILPPIVKSRGLHERCDRRQRRDIAAGMVTEEYLIKNGRRNAALPGGRPRVKRSYDDQIKKVLLEELKQQDQKRRKKKA